MKRFLMILVIFSMGLYSCNKTTGRPEKQKITVKGHIKFADANDKFGINVTKRNKDNEVDIIKKVILENKRFT